MTMPDYKKIESEAVSLGESEGQVKEFEGKLVRIDNSPKYPDNKNYIFEKDDGKQVTVFGTAFINQRLNETMIGKFIKLEYKGIDPKSRAKIVDVYVADS